MLENRIEGAAREAAGQAHDVVGKLTGDLGEQTSGKINEAAGALQKRYGKAADQLQDGFNRTAEGVQGLYGELDQLLQGRPYVALTAAVGIGLLLGMLLIGRRPIVVRKA